MSFNNPFSKQPDYGQGISDIINQVVQMMMLKKMGGGQPKSMSAMNKPMGYVPPAQMGIQEGPIGQNKNAADLFSDPRLLSALMKIIGGGGQY